MTTDTPINENYAFKITRNNQEMQVVEYNFPEDDFGKKMLSILLMQIAAHLDPALRGLTISEGQ